MDKKYRAVFVSPKDFGMADRDLFPFDNCSYLTTSDKFSKDFGWSPTVSLVDGLTNTYSEWRNSSNRTQTSYDKEDIVLSGQHIV
ncbi:MAG TPA: hypothetical protein VGF75_00660 [Candidatus Saccharimonadales bacterium]|jgi:nucleoside-diphosphate-sugar epimerase